jgi:hypothetical protein
MTTMIVTRHPRGDLMIFYSCLLNLFFKNHSIKLKVTKKSGFIGRHQKSKVKRLVVARKSISTPRQTY